MNEAGVFAMDTFLRPVDSRIQVHAIFGAKSVRTKVGAGSTHRGVDFAAGGMEAVYDDIVKDTGFLCFAPVQTARGRMFSARDRAQQPGEPATPVAVAEEEFYS